ncbi:Hsp20/alpha crystallin family protein [Sulfurimonas marina]|uniref:Hsp20/alpha crystallin family protein n=1 Tax=Sulfurimonas marina TaxID=2590551 RepID=A0A7M3V9J1_9BACT|nr:Hsp20/alpha crystallin family protein [Sulfurimonas marina]QOP40424.1 Hsp20/alpha crystallin family protein [Sulfurimonas marina]
MKRIIETLAFSSILASVAFAGTVFINDPYEDEFEKMGKYMNSLVESHMNASAIGNYNYPRTNVQDKKDEIVIEFDLAGVDKKDIQLSLDEQNILKLSGKKEHKVEEKKENGKYIRREIYYGSFQKAIQLPENIIQSSLETNYENGILTITIKKKELKKPKVKIIPIN